eukprot:jgi/Chlat1/2708/Chrsp180S02883
MATHLQSLRKFFVVIGHSSVKRSTTRSPTEVSSNTAMPTTMRTETSPTAPATTKTTTTPTTTPPPLCAKAKPKLLDAAAVAGRGASLSSAVLRDRKPVAPVAAPTAAAPAAATGKATLKGRNPSIRASAERKEMASPSGRKASLLDLESHYGFYAFYHRDGLNKAIHILCVWPILFTAQVLLTCVPRIAGPIPAPPSAPPSVHLIYAYVTVVDAALLVSLVYTIYYTLLDRKLGWLAGWFVLALCVAARVAVALGVNVLCWIAQFIGHGVFEGRRPALIDNFVQSFLMAPYFVFLEVVCAVSKYEPTIGFHTRVAEQIKFKDAQQKALLSAADTTNS